MNLVYAGFEDFLIGFKGEQGVAELCTNPDANHLVLTTESVKFSPFSGELHLVYTDSAPPAPNEGALAATTATRLPTAPPGVLRGAVQGVGALQAQHHLV